MFSIETRRVNGETKFVVRQVRTAEGQFVARYIGTTDSHFRAQLLKARAQVAA